jgi:5'-nucleotidase
MAHDIQRILVTNDDGIDAPGLVSAVRIAKQFCDDVWVFAPSEEKSGASHSISLAHPMRLIERGEKEFAITGSPADCVMVATRAMLKEKLPDLVISGVNFGQNIAEDVTYSGTVAGAKEGTVMGIRSIALSQALNLAAHPEDMMPRFEVSEKYAAEVIAKTLELEWPSGMLMNINFPDIDLDKDCDVRVTAQGRRDKMMLALEERRDPRNKPYFWYNFTRQLSTATPGTDIEAIMQGHISVTPLQMNHTHDDMKAELETLFE